MPEVHNPLGSSSSGAVLSRTVALTASQIRALDTTPIVLIPAPGAGNIIVVFGVAFVLNAGTQQFWSSSSDLLNPQYTGAANDLVVAAQVSGILERATSGFTYISGNTSAPLTLAGDENQGVELLSSAPYTAGPIATSTLGAGGAGYVANDTGRLTHGNGDATYRVLTVGAGGAVLTYSITDPGTAYPVENGSPTATGGAQPGVGVGFTVNITAVTVGNGTLKIVTFYSIIPVP